MAKIRIAADAPTPAGRNNRRGKLFERLMADVLRRSGYRVDRVPSTNYAGMEIDIEGTHTVTTHPLYAECKCYESEVDSPKFQAFFGKFITRWRKDARAHGLFIAIPGMNSHAKAFYNENCATETDFTVRLLEEDAVLDSLVQSGKLASLDVFSRAVPATRGTPGERDILITESGIVVVQRIIPPGTLVPSHITLFDAQGSPITDRASLDHIIDLDPELRSYELLVLGADEPLVASKFAEAEETIVEVKGGTECFEFQFPASPEHFVGRRGVLSEVSDLVSKVSTGATATRGILFEANSGWGKSSCALACSELLRKDGHLAIVIDSRSASSAQFILRVIEYVAAAFTGHGELPLFMEKITGFEGAAKLLINLGDALKVEGKVAMIILDQFENLFFLPDAFKRIRDLFLKVAGATTNILFGFCWKTDLVGLTNEFPYQLRDSIKSASRTIQVSKFSEGETNALLDKLSSEIRWPVRKDLRFFLSEFSQGYPWLLKKLCAHVKAQREAGVSQAEIANGLLNVEQLFEEDMNGLSPDEEEALRRIAKMSPVPVVDLADELKPQILQSLIDRRLIVRIGTKLDIYWDIFRDFLNTGKVPAQEQYLPRLGPRSIFKACRGLVDAGRPIPTADLATQLGLSAQSTYNVIHEMRMLGLAKVEREALTLQLPLSSEKDLPRAFTQHLGDKLRRNRLVQFLLTAIEIRGELTLIEVADLLREKCPYISASASTWKGYAEVFCGWMEAAALGIYDKRKERLLQYLPEQHLTQHPLPAARRRGGVQVFQVHYSPVEALASCFAEFLKNRRLVWPPMGPSTREKALTMLEDFGFIVRSAGPLRLSASMNKFLVEGAVPSVVLGEAALQVSSFKEFLAILEERKGAKCSLLQLGHDLRTRTNADWGDGTAQTTAKILLDWARHTGNAPGVFATPLNNRRASSARTR